MGYERERESMSMALLHKKQPPVRASAGVYYVSAQVFDSSFDRVHLNISVRLSRLLPWKSRPLFVLPPFNRLTRCTTQ